MDSGRVAASTETHRRALLRFLTAVFFIVAGLLHFAVPQKYRQIIPPGFPDPALLVAISGVGEIVGGIGLLIRPLRRAAGWGLIVLLVAVFPANVYMAFHPAKFAELQVPTFLLWLRLPLQGVLIGWVYWISRSRGVGGK